MGAVNTQAIINAIVAEGGFDTSAVDSSRTIILGWVQQRYDMALEESGWRRAPVALGPTVAGQAQYLVPAHVIDLKMLRVDGSKPWKRVTTEELWLLQANAAQLRGAPGAFAPNFEADADAVVELWPAPTVAGKTIDALCAIKDTVALTDSSGSTPAVPDGLHRELFVMGAIAIGRVLVDERADLAGPFESAWDSGLKKLMRRTKSRIGSGVWQANVAGRS